MPELASFQNVTQFECVISQDRQFTEVGDYKPNHVLYLSFTARNSSKGMISFTCQTNGEQKHESKHFNLKEACESMFFILLMLRDRLTRSLI